MTGYGIGFPKNSPYVARVNQFMLQYQQSGDELGVTTLQASWSGFRIFGSLAPASLTAMDRRSRRRSEWRIL